MSRRSLNADLGDKMPLQEALMAKFNLQIRLCTSCTPVLSPRRPMADPVSRVSNEEDATTGDLAPVLLCTEHVDIQVADRED